MEELKSADFLKGSISGSIAEPGKQSTVIQWEWDTESGSAIGNPLIGHMEEVICVSPSSDGKQVVS